MQPVRLFTIVAGSVGLAIAAGTLFQPDPGAAPAVDLAADQATTAPMAQTGPTLAGGVPSLGRMLPGADMRDEGAVDQAEIAPQTMPLLANLTEIEAAEPEIAEEIAELLAEAADCAVWLVVTPEPAAMLDLSLFAPCDAGEPVAIAHGPLRLAATIGADGRLAMMLPALASQAEMTVAFVDGRVETDATDVPDFGMFPRIVVQWDGPQVLDLHAYAGGATWGEPGHVKAGGPVSAVTGFVTALQSQAETQSVIYTYPAGLAPQDGSIMLEAEVAVTADSCGRALDVRVQMVRDDAPVSRRDIRVDMPACDAPGGFVLLPDLLPEALPTMATLN